MSATLLSIPGTSACFSGGVNAYSLSGPFSLSHTSSRALMRRVQRGKRS